MKSTGRINLFVRLMIAMCVLFAIVMIIQLRTEKEELKEQTDAYRVQLAQKQDEIEELEELLNREMDEEYIKQLAHEQMNYCMPGEEIVYND